MTGTRREDRLGEPTDERPVVRISRMEVAISVPGRGKQQRQEATRWTVYGVDADGHERVYVEHATEEEHEAWRASDPLWGEAQRAIFDRLLSDPKTRDFVLQLNIKAALDSGNTETAVELARHLSPGGMGEADSRGQRRRRQRRARLTWLLTSGRPVVRCPEPHRS